MLLAGSITPFTIYFYYKIKAFYGLKFLIGGKMLKQSSSFSSPKSIMGLKELEFEDESGLDNLDLDKEELFSMSYVIIWKKSSSIWAPAIFGIINDFCAKKLLFLLDTEVDYS